MSAKESEQNGPTVTGKEPGGPPRRMQGRDRGSEQFQGPETYPRTDARENKDNMRILGSIRIDGR